MPRARFVLLARGAILWPQTTFQRVKNALAENGAVPEAARRIASDVPWECTCPNSAAPRFVKNAQPGLCNQSKTLRSALCAFQANT
jgi:hypothetical protein